MPFEYELVAPALGAVTSLIAGGRNKAQQEAERLRKQAEDNIRRQQGAVANVGQLTDSSRTALSGVDARAQGATNKYADYLERDPYTDEFESAQLNEATRGNDADYARNRADITGDLAARGLGTSSLSTGELASLGDARAAATGQARNALAMQRIAERKARMQEVARILAAARSGYRDETIGGYGAQESGYGNVANAELGMAGNAQGRADAESAGTSALYGGLGTSIAQLLAKKRAATDQGVSASRWHL